MLNPLNTSFRRFPFLALCGVALLAPALSLQAARTAYYQFEDAADPGLDSADGDDVATLLGGARITKGAVAGTGAWLLDGKTPGFTIQPAGSVDADFSATENFTVSAWFRVDAAKGRQRILSGTTWGMGMDFNNSTPRLLVTAYAIEDKFFDVPQLVTGKWHQMTVVVKPTDVEGVVYTHVFLDGQPVAPAPDNGFYNSNTGIMQIGSAGGGFEGFNGALDEIGYYDNALSDTEVQDSYDAIVVDTDGDGMPDFWENAYGLLANSNTDKELDKDLDGRDNLEEYNLGLLPDDPDTDGDGLSDGAENLTGIYNTTSDAGTDPKNPDTDGDTIPDGAEKAITATDLYATDPNLRDTDGDRIPDHYEIFIGGSDPTDAESPVPVPNLVAEYRFELPEEVGLDSAGGDDPGTVAGGQRITVGALSGTGAFSLNGLTAGLSIGAGTFDADPDFSATENFTVAAWVRVAEAAGRQRIFSGNGWGFGVDYLTTGNPGLLMTAYTIEDRFYPAPEIIAGKWAHVAVVVYPADGGGVVQTEAFVNGVSLGRNDGSYNMGSNFGIGSSGAGSNFEAFNGLLDEVRYYDTAITKGTLDALVAVGNSDEDEDGIPANWELTYGLDPNNAADAAGDLDGDGVTNLVEYSNGLRPDLKDTDGDTLEDGVEDGGGVYVDTSKTGTDPKKTDTDGDGILDAAEKAVTDTDLYVTDPNLPDTDGDAYPDGYEVTMLNSDPTDPASPNRPAGLVAHYEFEDAGNLGADSAGNDDTATPVGSGYQVVPPDAKIGEGALSLGGSDYLRIGQGNLLADIDFRAIKGFSAASWFNFTNSSGRQRILSGFPAWGMGLDFPPTGPGTVLLTAFGVVDQFYPAVLTPNEWHHMAFTVSAPADASDPEVIMYLDGAEIGRHNFRFNRATNFAIGSGSSDSANETFAGLLDDVRYYNLTLSAAAVAELAGVTTDPSFVITGVSRTAGLVTLSFASEPGASYRIQRSATLSDWINVGGNVPSQGASTTWTEPALPPAPADRYFYRVVKN